MIHCFAGTSQQLYVGQGKDVLRSALVAPLVDVRTGGEVRMGSLLDSSTRCPLLVYERFLRRYRQPFSVTYRPSTPHRTPRTGTTVGQTDA